jgi:hypothetical protein
MGHDAVRPGPPRRLPAADAARLRARLSREHHRRPFGPHDVRDGARRVLALAEDLGLQGHIARGGLDVGGAELDHVWAVVDAHVVDVAMPLLARDFVAVLRRYVAGDVGAGDLERAAAAWALEWRVVGDVPAGCRYLGRPILSHRGRADRT